MFKQFGEVVSKEHGVFAVYGPFRSTEGFFSTGDEKVSIVVHCRSYG